MVEAVRLARRIAAVRPLAALIDREMAPGAGVVEDDALLAAITAGLDTYHHGSATVPMGGSRDAGAVVDAVGRVRGVQGLRVVDASIFPRSRRHRPTGRRSCWLNGSLPVIDVGGREEGTR